MIVASIAVIAVAVLVAAFFAGSRLAANGAVPAVVRTSAPAARSAPPSRTPTPTPTPTAGPIEAGVHPWQALLGGECLDPYRSPWQTTYAVVACSVKHAGQLTRRVRLKGDDYPGAPALIATLSLSCSGSAAVTLSSAARYSDLRTAFSYPTEDQWRAGDTVGYCFTSRAAGAAMTGSVTPK